MHVAEQCMPEAMRCAVAPNPVAVPPEPPLQPAGGFLDK